MSREELDFQAVVAYCLHGSYRKAGEALYVSPSVIHERVKRWREGNLSVLPSYAISTAERCVRISQVTMTAGPSLS